MDNSKTFPINTKSAGGGVLDSVSPNINRNNKYKIVSFPFPNQENQNEKPDLLATPELANAGSVEFIASELSQTTNQNNDDENKTASKQNNKLFEGLTGQPKEDSEQHLAPKLPEITPNDGGSLERQFRINITSSSPSDSFQYVESKEDENWDFMGITQGPRSGSPVGSSLSSTPSIYHDATSDREESLKVGINLGNKHDKFMEELQQNLETCQTKSRVVAEQPTAENEQEWTAWQEEKAQHYTEEMQKIKDKHVSELNAQKETLQKTIKIEIGREKARLMQEFNLRISQEITKACKKQEFRIKQLSRINFNLRAEKEGQEMDMEAFRKTIASQEEDLLKIPELMQSLDKANREIGTLHKKIGILDKMAKEAISQAEQTDKELEKTKCKLETAKKDFGLDSASDAENVPGSTIRAWTSDKRTSKSKNQESKLKIVTKELAEAKATVESQGGQNNLLKEEILRLGKAREEDNTVIKSHRRKIHSLEGLPTRVVVLSKSVEDLRDELQKSSEIEEQDKAIIRQQKFEIEELVVSRDKLKRAQESLDAKQSNLNETKIKLEHNEIIIRQQQNEIEELVVARDKLERAQEFLDAKQTDLNETLVKLEHDEVIIKLQQNEIGELVVERDKLKRAQKYLDVKQTDLNETLIKLEHGEVIMKQQQNEIEELAVARDKLKRAEEYLDAMQTDLNETLIKLEHGEVIIKQQQTEIEELAVAKARLKGAQESLDAKQTDLNKVMIKLEHDEVIIKQQQREIHELKHNRAKLQEMQSALNAKQADLVVTKAKLKEIQISLDAKQTDMNETMIKLERDKATIEQQERKIQELAVNKTKLKEIQKSHNAKQIDLEKTTMKLEQANHELRNLQRLQQEKDNAMPKNFSESNRGRPALIDRLVPSEPKAVVVSSSYLDTQNRLHNDSRAANTLASPKNNNKEAIPPSPPLSKIELLGAEDIAEESEDDGLYYGVDTDDENQSLHKLLEMAVAGGAAILRKLEKMRPIEL